MNWITIASRAAKGMRDAVKRLSRRQAQQKHQKAKKEHQHSASQKEKGTEKSSTQRKETYQQRMDRAKEQAKEVKEKHLQIDQATDLDNAGNENNGSYQPSIGRHPGLSDRGPGRGR